MGALYGSAILGTIVWLYGLLVSALLLTQAEFLYSHSQPSTVELISLVSVGGLFAILGLVGLVAGWRATKGSPRSSVIHTVAALVFTVVLGGQTLFQDRPTMVQMAAVVAAVVLTGLAFTSRHGAEEKRQKKKWQEMRNP